jgi:hypothetical protein
MRHADGLSAFATWLAVGALALWLLAGEAVVEGLVRLGEMAR